MRGVFFNQDSTEFFYTHAAEEMSGELIEAWVDRLAEAGVGVLVSNVNAMRTNYPSRVWETDWEGYNPAAGDDQPLLRHYTPQEAAIARRRLEAQKRLAELGINFHERAFARCRQHQIGCWASIRMNDLHDCHLPDSPLLSSFYKQQRAAGHVRVPYRYTGWHDKALDWARPNVQAHYLRLVEEVLNFSGLEGLELDWMRFPYHFRMGHELEGGQILTEWIAQVRELCQKRAQRVGHPILLGCRVPSTPETARRLGLDGVAWARAGLIDLLVVTPFWATCEFNMPIREWKRMLEATTCALAGGLEVLYRPFPEAPARMMTPALARGAATAILHSGADFVYLFNYFADMHLGAYWTAEEYKQTLKAMQNLRELQKLPRRHALTYRDTRAPGEPEDKALPAPGPLCVFRISTGPRPIGQTIRVLLELELADNKAPAPPRLRVNSVLCPLISQEEAAVFVFSVPPEAMMEEETVVEAEAVVTSIRRVEIEIF